jgi:type I restriction enzyme M protein
MNSFNDLPIKLLSDFESKIDELSKKYETTYSDLEQEISKTEKSLTLMLDDLEGNDFDMLGLEEFKTLLGGK